MGLESDTGDPKPILSPNRPVFPASMGFYFNDSLHFTSDPSCGHRGSRRRDLGNALYPDKNFQVILCGFRSWNGAALLHHLSGTDGRKCIDRSDILDIFLYIFSCYTCKLCKMIWSRFNGCWKKIQI